MGTYVFSIQFGLSQMLQYKFNLKFLAIVEVMKGSEGSELDEEFRGSVSDGEVFDKGIRYVFSRVVIFRGLFSRISTKNLYGFIMS